MARCSNGPGGHLLVGVDRRAGREGCGWLWPWVWLLRGSRDWAPWSPTGARKASFRVKGRSGEGMERCSTGSGSVTRRVAPETRRHPPTPWTVTPGVGRVLHTWAASWFQLCRVRTLAKFGAILLGGGRAPCTLRPRCEPVPTGSGHSLTCGNPRRGCWQQKPRRMGLDNQGGQGCRA